MLSTLLLLRKFRPAAAKLAAVQAAAARKALNARKAAVIAAQAQAAE